MKINVSLVREYIPSWRDNKSDEEPIVVEHRAPTLTLRNKLIPQPKVVLHVDKDGRSEGAESTVTVDNWRICESMVENFRNFELEVEENGKSRTIVVQTMKELSTSNYIPSEVGGLIDELGAYFQKILQAGIDEKK